MMTMNKYAQYKYNLTRNLRDNIRPTFHIDSPLPIAIQQRVDMNTPKHKESTFPYKVIYYKTYVNLYWRSSAKENLKYIRTMLCLQTISYKTYL